MLPLFPVLFARIFTRDAVLPRRSADGVFY